MTSKAAKLKEVNGVKKDISWNAEIRKPLRDRRVDEAKGKGKNEIRYISVENPMFSHDHPVSRTNPKRVHSPVNMRESPATWMFCHNQIDYAEYEAARKYRAIYEASHGFSVGSMDHSNIRVDGGESGDGFSDRQLDAIKVINSIKKLINNDYETFQKVFGYCEFLKDSQYTRWKKSVKYKELKDSLSVLVEYFDLSNKVGVYWKDVS